MRGRRRDSNEKELAGTKRGSHSLQRPNMLGSETEAVTRDPFANDPPALLPKDMAKRHARHISCDRIQDEARVTDNLLSLLSGTH